MIFANLLPCNIILFDYGLAGLNIDFGENDFSRFRNLLCELLVYGFDSVVERLVAGRGGGEHSQVRCTWAAPVGIDCSHQMLAS
jgi:hypothetical protein